MCVYAETDRERVGRERGRLWELVKMTLEVWKSYKLPSASWTTRHTIGVIKSHPKAWALKYKGRRRMCQLKQDSKVTLTLLFSPIQTFSGSDNACLHYKGESSLSILLNQILTFSRNTLTDTHRKCILPAFWVSCQDDT